MGKSNKAITKGCPYCGMQIAVACKNCPGCKRVLISNNKKATPTVCATPAPAPEPSLSSRRTSRVKREKPKFYDASQFENKKQKRRRPEPLEPPPAPPPRNQRPPPALNRKKIKKKVKIPKEEIVEEEEPVISVPGEKVKQFSVVLNELNMKLFSTSWSAAL